VRTYADAWLWPIGAGGVPAALTATPTHVALPRQPQGEGIAFDGRRLLVDSEGVGTAVYSVSLPVAATGPSPTPSPSSPSSPAAATASPSPSSSAPRSASSGRASTDRTGLVVGGAAVVVVLAGAALIAGRRRRRG
jgi:hypothetical protein